MGSQIIKQPNGKYAVFSSIVDDFMFYDATPEDVIGYFVEQEAKSIKNLVTLIIDGLTKGEKPYHQFTMTWPEALDWAKQVHGDKWKAPKIDTGTK